MRRLPRSLGPLGLLLLLAGAMAIVATCSQSDTIVFVNVQATEPLSGIVRLHANVKIGNQIRDLNVPESPTNEIAFPTSFTVQVGRSVTGRLDVTVDGYDAASALVASGKASLTALTVGSQNSITIDLAPGAPPDGGVDDGGAPDVTGSGGTDGGVDMTASGGAGGTAMGGAGGPGGAGGRAGAGGGAGKAGAGGAAGGTSDTGGLGGGAGGAVSTGGVAGTGGATSTGGATTGGAGGGGASDMGGTPAGGAGGQGGMDLVGGASGNPGAGGDTGGAGGGGAGGST